MPRSKIKPGSQIPEEAAFHRLCRLLDALSLLAGTGCVAFAIGRWLLIGQGIAADSPLALAGMLLPPQALVAGLGQPAEMAWQWRLAGMALEVLPLAALFYTLGALRRICAALQQAEIFSGNTVRGFRQLAYGLLAMALTHLAYGAGATALLSWLASGQRGGFTVITLGPFDYAVLMAGALTFVLQRVMAEGRRLQDDAAAFV